MHAYLTFTDTTDVIEPLSTVRIRQMTDPSERFSADCPGQEDLNTIYRNFAPYLYPFIIEFCILIVGIFYMIWANINHCPKKLSASGHGHDNHGSPQHGNSLETNNFTSLGSIPEEGQFPSGRGAAHNAPPSEVSDHCNNLVEHEYEYKSSIVVYADCHAASRGLFGKYFFISELVLASSSMWFNRWNGFDDSDNCFHHFAACCCQRAVRVSK